MDAPIVIFELAGQRLALPAAAVRECLPLPRLWRRPGSPDAVAGFFRLGGPVLPVIDLAVLLGLRRADEGGTLEQDGLYRPLLHVGDAALLVDRLEQVAHPDPEAPEPASDPWQHGCVLRHLFAAGAPVALLDPSRILLAGERASLDALTRAASERAAGWNGGSRDAADADAT